VLASPREYCFVSLKNSRNLVCFAIASVLPSNELKSTTRFEELSMHTIKIYVLEKIQNHTDIVSRRLRHIHRKQSAQLQLIRRV
jgi:hypothetical protein